MLNNIYNIIYNKNYKKQMKMIKKTKKKKTIIIIMKVINVRKVMRRRRRCAWLTSEYILCCLERLYYIIFHILNITNVYQYIYVCILYSWTIVLWLKFDNIPKFVLSFLYSKRHETTIRLTAVNQQMQINKVDQSS